MHHRIGHTLRATLRVRYLGLQIGVVQPSWTRTGYHLTQPTARLDASAAHPRRAPLVATAKHLLRRKVALPAAPAGRSHRAVATAPLLRRHLPRCWVAAGRCELPRIDRARREVALEPRHRVGLPSRERRRGGRRPALPHSTYHGEPPVSPAARVSVSTSNSITAS